MSEPVSQSRLDRILREVDQVSVDMLTREPFFGHFFTGMLRKVSSEAPTLGVQLAEHQQVQLVVNPDFWDTQLTTPELRYGLIKHELLHIVLKHVLARNLYPLKVLFNIAADIVVNQYVDHDHLPGSPVLFEDFARLGIQRGEDVGYYYEKLLEEVHKRREDKPPRHQRKALKRLKDLLENEDEALSRHADWESFDDLPAAARNVLETSIDQALQRTLSRTDHHGQEMLPHPLKTELEKLAERKLARVHWRRVLRLFSGTSQASRLQNTIRRPSKRYGTTPGTRLVRRQRLLVAVDTSASVTPDEVSAFFDEIHHVWRLGTRVQVLAIDTDIRDQFEYKGYRKLEIAGRGGTSFEPAFVYAKETWQPDGLIYFTDGLGPAPVTRLRQPVLWLITAQGIKPDTEAWDQLPGRKVKMTT